jgi:transcription elongation GreA/GreB family factor
LGQAQFKVKSAKYKDSPSKSKEHRAARSQAPCSRFSGVYKQTRLFDEPNLFSQEEKKKVASGSKVNIRRLSDGQEFLYHITPTAIKGNFTGKHKQILPDSALALAMMGLEVGGRFEFGGRDWEVVNIL